MNELLLLTINIFIYYIKLIYINNITESCFLRILPMIYDFFMIYNLVIFLSLLCSIGCGYSR